MQYYPPMPNVHDVNRKSILIHPALPVQMMTILIIVKYNNSIIMGIILGMMVVRNSHVVRVVVVVVISRQVVIREWLEISRIDELVYRKCQELYTPVNPPLIHNSLILAAAAAVVVDQLNNKFNNSNSSVNNNFANRQQQIAYQNQLQQQQKQHKQAAINQLQTIQSSLTNYGLNYSPSQFYPYLSNNNDSSNSSLPQQVEKEKSVNKVYPLLYKLAVNSTQSYNDDGGGMVEQDQGKGVKQDEMKTPLYTLFDKHIGALPNSNVQMEEDRVTGC